MKTEKEITAPTDGLYIVSSSGWNGAMRNYPQPCAGAFKIFVEDKHKGVIEQWAIENVDLNTMLKELSIERGGVIEVWMNCNGFMRIQI